MKILGLVAGVLLLTSASNSVFAQSFAENVATLDPAARAWAESYANPDAFVGDWSSGGGQASDRLPPILRYEDGQFRSIASGRLEIENLRHVRTTEERGGLVHEFTVTCYSQYGPAGNSTPGTLKVTVRISSAYNEYPASPGDMTGFVRTEGCRVLKLFGPVFR